MERVCPGGGTTPPCHRETTIGGGTRIRTARRGQLEAREDRPQGPAGWLDSHWFAGVHGQLKADADAPQCPKGRLGRP
jgi:hypothetical protein